MSLKYLSSFLIFFIILACNNGKVKIGNNEFDSVDNFIDNKAIFIVNDKKGIINRKGEILVPSEYKYIRHAYDDFYIVSKNGLEGILKSTNNSFIIPLNYDYLYHVNDEYFGFVEDGLDGMMNINNNIIIPPVMDYINGVYNDKYVFVTTTSKNEDYKDSGAIFNFNSKPLTDAKYSSVESYNNNLFVLKYNSNNSYNSNDYYDIYDARNNISRSNSLPISSISKVVRYGKNKDKFLIKGFKNHFEYGIISYDGRYIVNFGILDDIVYLDDDLLAVYKENYGYGIINGNGILRTKLIFDYVGAFNNNRINVRLKNKEFFINKYGVCVSNCPSKDWLSYHNIDEIKFDENNYNNLVNLGIESGKSGDYSKSIEYFDQALASNPLNIDIYLDKAISYYMSEYYNRSYEMVTEFLKYSPKNYESSILLGNLSMQKNKYLEAALIYEKAIKLDPDRIDGYLKAAIAFGKEGFYDQSCRYLKIACSKGSSDGCNGFNNFCN